MLENSFKIQLINYWRNIDKKIFFCFIILFVLGLFFSFSSTSSLAGERLNKDYYFFFSKHLFFTFIALIIMLLISLLEKIWPDKKSYTGDDVNKLIHALTYSANVKKLKDTIVKQPAIEELTLLNIELDAKNARKAELEQKIKER